MCEQKNFETHNFELVNKIMRKKGSGGRIGGHIFYAICLRCKEISPKEKVKRSKGQYQKRDKDLIARAKERRNNWCIKHSLNCPANNSVKL